MVKNEFQLEYEADCRDSTVADNQRATDRQAVRPPSPWPIHLMLAVNLVAIAILSYFEYSRRVVEMTIQQEIATQRLVIESRNGHKLAEISAQGDDEVDFFIGRENSGAGVSFHVAKDSAEMTLNNSTNGMIFRSSQGLAEFALLGPSRTPQVRLMTHGDERALLLLHENGSPMAGLFGTRSACQLVVFDPNANPSVAFGLCENGPGLVLQDFSGVPRLAASIIDGIPNLVMRDENGKVQQTLLPSPDPVQGPNAATRPP